MLFSLVLSRKELSHVAVVVLHACVTTPTRLICHIETSPTAPVCQRSAAPDVQGGKKGTTQDNISEHTRAGASHVRVFSVLKSKVL